MTISRNSSQKNRFTLDIESISALDHPLTQDQKHFLEDFYYSKKTLRDLAEWRKMQ